MELAGITEFNAGQSRCQIVHLKDKILKYDQFLARNKVELESAEYLKSIGLAPTINPSP